MRRYWYYTFETADTIGFEICSTCVGDFDLYRELMRMEAECGKFVMITGWHEISKEQYEKLKIYFDNQPK